MGIDKQTLPMELTEENCHIESGGAVRGASCVRVYDHHLLNPSFLIDELDLAKYRHSS